MKAKHVATHMAVAELYAQLSYDTKRKVGCVIIIDGIVVPGYNGTPAGWDNLCNDPATGKTFEHVIHAEQNALDKITRSALSSVGASVFVTTAPCIQCAKRLEGAKIKEVFYRDSYKNNDGLEHLRKAGVTIERIENGIRTESSQNP